VDMASISTTARVKVIGLLHEGVTSTFKLWSFEVRTLTKYTLEGIRIQIMSLFPHLEKKNY